MINSRLSRYGLSAVVALTGVINLVEAALPKEPAVIDWMELWIPFQVSEGSRILMLLTGVMLMSLAHGLARSKRAAWALTVAAIIISPILHLGRAFDWYYIIVNTVILIWLLYEQQQFTARSDEPSIRWALALAVPILFGFAAYGVLNFRNLPGEFSGATTLDTQIQATLELVFLQSTDTAFALTPRAQTIFLTVRFGGIITCLTAMLLILRPVLPRVGAQPDDRIKIATLVAEGSNDPLHAFASADDKHYAFLRHGSFAFALWRNYAVTLGGPIAASDPALAIEEFLAYCKRQDWQPVFYQLLPEYLSACEASHLSTLKIGEEARISVAGFELKGGKFQNLRTACNKAKKNEQRFVWYDPGEKVDYGLEAQLQLVSQEWLQDKRGGELKFAMGSFSVPGLTRLGGCAVVLNADDRLEAFATWLPYNRGKGRCIDVMRYRYDARDIMSFLIVESIDHFRAQGIEEVSLGTAPLADTETPGSDTPIEQKGIRYIFENFNAVYGYKSLFFFKEKFQPQWVPRYLACHSKLDFPMAALAVARVHLPSSFLKLISS